jgi:hypothetical protein
MLGLVQLEAMVLPLTGRAQCAPTAGADAYETRPKNTASSTGWPGSRQACSLLYIRIHVNRGTNEQLGTRYCFYRYLVQTAIVGILWRNVATENTLISIFVVVTLFEDELFDEAPITEELVFRACIIPLLLCGGFKMYNIMFFSPVLFSLGKLLQSHLILEEPTFYIPNLSMT